MTSGLGREVAEVSFYTLPNALYFHIFVLITTVLAWQSGQVRTYKDSTSH